MIDVLMITYNRPDYTRMSLERLLESCEDGVRVWIWHNGEHAETLAVARALADHPSVYRFHHSPENAKLRPATNWVLNEGNGAYFAKVDDDCLVVEGWHQRLVEALESDPRLAIAACWHFQESDFDAEVAAPKLVEFANGQRFMLNGWVQGSGIMLKRSCIEAVGVIPERFNSFTPYCKMISQAGWMMGWPLPLVPIDHMDDPRSVHSRFKTEADFAANPPLGASFGDVRSLAEWKERVKWLARDVQLAPLDPDAGKGLRGRASRAKEKLKRVMGVEPAWRVAAREAQKAPNGTGGL